VANNDTIKKTVIVTLLLCFVCSVVVSTAAVVLKPMQVANKELDFKRNILSAAGMLEPGANVEQIFSERIVTRVVELDTGKFTDAVDSTTYDQRRAARDASLSTNLSKQEDIAGISRRENYAMVYLVEENGSLNKIVLPIKGYGLWSTLYGFVALEADANTILGLGFYEHGETPGLGGEIDNPNWKAQWEGKKVYDSEGEVAITVLKGRVDPSSPRAQYQVDGLSGATLTGRGVHNLVQFWLGESGFKRFLDNLQKGEA
jgi:Na+-transporting NADH:ubiquinone oxidoreductase subunit C